MFKALLILVLLLLFPLGALADSPLTSTPFSSFYGEDPLVASAESQGLSEDLVDKLRDPAVDQGTRAAIINALGWSATKRDYAKTFLSVVSEDLDLPLQALRSGDLSDEELFTYTYLLALDHYLDLTPLEEGEALTGMSPLDLVQELELRNTGSLSVAIISGLIVAQSHLRSDWCAVYEAVSKIDQKAFSEDIKQEALAQIFDYLSLYQNECTHPRPVSGSCH